MNLLGFFLGRECSVHFEDVSVEGKLIRWQPEDRELHTPFILILKDDQGNFILIRSWDRISVSV